MDPKRLEARAVARLLRVSLATARRRLSGWFATTKSRKAEGLPCDTCPRTELCSDFLRRGRSSYFTTLAELLLYYPEINTDG